MRIAFVCLGNICRSPMAEAVTLKLLEEADPDRSHSVSVESFGTADHHVGEPADAQARAALDRAGWPDTAHRARQIQARDLDRLDLVLCADRANLAAVLRLAPPGFDRSAVRLLLGDQEVPDPWGRSDAVFDEVLAEIEAACRELVSGLAGGPD